MRPDQRNCLAEARIDSMFGEGRVGNAKIMPDDIALLDIDGQYRQCFRRQTA